MTKKSKLKPSNLEFFDITESSMESDFNIDFTDIKPKVKTKKIVIIEKKSKGKDNSLF